MPSLVDIDPVVLEKRIFKINVFTLFCNYDVTEARRCKRRNENRVIYHHSVERILANCVVMEVFFFPTNFQIRDTCSLVIV